MKLQIARSIVAVLKRLLFLNSANKFSSYLLENVDLVYDFSHNGLNIKIACPNRVNLYRAETYLTKEPDMIDWLETMDSNVVLLDIGANIGLYSIYAAKKGVKQVIAVEPESQNYGLLNKNIHLNHLSDKITALNIGFNDVSGLNHLFIPNFLPGAALNNLGESTNWKKEAFNADFRQSVMAYSVDDFLLANSSLFPTHIKIDVDGIERRIIEGASKTLKDDRVRQVIIELNTSLPEDMEIIDILKGHGFKLVDQKNSATAAAKEYDVLYNCLFIK
jgi:FkbM family methyltransferase